MPPLNHPLIINRVIFILALVGLGVSLYLFATYVSHSPIVCLSGEGCETVRSSPYSYLGGMPIPAFGLVGFTLIALVSFLMTLGGVWIKYLPTLLLGMSAVGFLFVTYLTALEAWVIKSYCSWCLIAAFCQTLIFGLSWYRFTLKNESGK